MIRPTVTPIHTGTRPPPRIGPDGQNWQPLHRSSAVRARAKLSLAPIHNADCEGYYVPVEFGHVNFDERLRDAERGEFADLPT